ncbi:MAG: J domain-containing protein [Acidobacteriota bacterium]|nr:J domain-containing protein [Acidobacteriota bacterium]
MANHGNLTPILLEMHREGQSGVLRFERGKEKKQLLLIGGTLAGAESNLPGEHLARIMVAQGALPKPALREVTSLMKGGRGLEEALRSLAGAPKVAEGRREQAIAILASLWAWKDPLLRFYQGEGLLPDRLNLALPLPEALVASARRAVSSRLVSLPAGYAAGSWSPAGTADLPWDRGEATALAALEQPRRTTELVEILRPGADRPEEVLLVLALLGRARFEPGKEVGEVAAPVEPPSADRELEERLERAAGGTLYDLLEVPPDAGPNAIRDAYHALARRFHPDRFQSAEHGTAVRASAQRLFAAVNEAWSTLRDPAARAAYDRSLAAGAEKKATKEDDQKTADTLYRSGRALLARGEFAQAAERLKGSVWLRPEHAAYRHALGMAEARLPRMQKSAEGHLLKAIELDPLRFDSRLELARIYLEAGLRRRAEAQVAEVLRWDRENQEALRLQAEMRGRRR